MSHRARRKRLGSWVWTLALMTTSGAAVLLVLDVLEAIR